MRKSFKPSRSVGFSLVELLVVMGVLAVFLALVAPAFTSLSQGTALTRAGHELADAVKSGREEAMTRNRKVWLRLIKVSDDRGKKQFRALQLWIVKDDSGAMTPLTKVIHFPPGILLTESTGLSPLLQTPPAKGGTMEVAGTDCDYVCFAITANGDLESTVSNTSSFLTLVQEKDAGAAAPANFYSIFINPVTGEFSTFRP